MSPQEAVRHVDFDPSFGRTDLVRHLEAIAGQAWPKVVRTANLWIQTVKSKERWKGDGSLEVAVDRIGCPACGRHECMPMLDGPGRWFWCSACHWSGGPVELVARGLRCGPLDAAMALAQGKNKVWDSGADAIEYARAVVLPRARRNDAWSVWSARPGLNPNTASFGPRSLIGTIAGRHRFLEDKQWLRDSFGACTLEEAASVFGFASHRSRHLPGSARDLAIAWPIWDAPGRISGCIFFHEQEGEARTLVRDQGACGVTGLPTLLRRRGLGAILSGVSPELLANLCIRRADWSFGLIAGLIVRGDADRRWDYPWARSLLARDDLIILRSGKEDECTEGSLIALARDLRARIGQFDPKPLLDQGECSNGIAMDRAGSFPSDWKESAERLAERIGHARAIDLLDSCGMPAPESVLDHRAAAMPPWARARVRLSRKQHYAIGSGKVVWEERNKVVSPYEAIIEGQAFDGVKYVWTGKVCCSDGSVFPFSVARSRWLTSPHLTIRSIVGDRQVKSCSHPLTWPRWLHLMILMSMELLGRDVATRTPDLNGDADELSRLLSERGVSAGSPVAGSAP